MRKAIGLLVLLLMVSPLLGCIGEDPIKKQAQEKLAKYGYKVLGVSRGEDEDYPMSFLYLDDNSIDDYWIAAIRGINILHEIYPDDVCYSVYFKTPGEGGWIRIYWAKDTGELAHQIPVSVPIVVDILKELPPEISEEQSHIWTERLRYCKLHDIYIYPGVGK